MLITRVEGYACWRVSKKDRLYQRRNIVKQLTKQAEERGYKFQDIVVAVVESVPFQKMRAGGVKKK